MYFKAVVEKDEDGMYCVHVPALPGCHTQGKTKKQALKNAIDAINGYLESLQKDGISIGSQGGPTDVELALVFV